MKRIITKIFVLLFILSLLPIFAAKNTRAMNTGLTVEEMSSEEKEDFINNELHLCICSEPAKIFDIECFNANENGLFAVGLYTASVDWLVSVYSNEGNFMYAFRFDHDGQIELEWDGDLINVFEYESNTVFSVDSSGKVIEVCRVFDNDNNIEYLKRLEEPVKKAGNTEYILRKGQGLDKYSLVAVDTDGTERTIYSVKSIFRSNMLLLIIIDISVLIAAAIIVPQIIKRKRAYSTKFNTAGENRLRSIMQADHTHKPRFFRMLFLISGNEFYCKRCGIRLKLPKKQYILYFIAPILTVIFNVSMVCILHKIIEINEFLFGQLYVIIGSSLLLLVFLIEYRFMTFIPCEDGKNEKTDLS